MRHDAKFRLVTSMMLCNFVIGLLKLASLESTLCAKIPTIERKMSYVNELTYMTFLRINLFRFMAGKRSYNQEMKLRENLKACAKIKASDYTVSYSTKSVDKNISIEQYETPEVLKTKVAKSCYSDGFVRVVRYRTRTKNILCRV